jgi:hypothetical protein
MIQIAITIVGVLGCLALFVGFVTLCLCICAKAFEKASRETIKTARAEERASCANHYLATSWWFSEYPDVKKALRLVAMEIVSGRMNSSQLRDDFHKNIGRK